MHCDLEEDDLQFVVEAANEHVKKFKDRAQDMSERLEDPQEITTMYGHVQRLERAVERVQRAIDKSYFE